MVATSDLWLKVGYILGPIEVPLKVGGSTAMTEERRGGDKDRFLEDSYSKEKGQESMRPILILAELNQRV